MIYDYQLIALPQISDDDTFRISTGNPTDRLQKSIEHVGLINPPILLPSGEENFRIVSGFARIAACRMMGWERLTARILPLETSLAHCALIAIADNAAQRELNPVELSRALTLLAKSNSSREEFPALLQSLGIKAGKDLLTKLMQVAQMSACLQNGIISGSIALPVALQLHNMHDAAAADELGQLLHELQMSLNRQREIVDWVQAMLHRDGSTVSQVLGQDQIRIWREDKQMDPRHRGGLIRQLLRQKRYPEISAFEKKYAQVVKQINPAGGLQVVPPLPLRGANSA